MPPTLDPGVVPAICTEDQFRVSRLVVLTPWKIERLADGRNHKRNVIAKFAIAEFRHFLHDAALGLRGGTPGGPCYLYDTLGAKLDRLLVFCFRYTVSKKQQAIIGNQLLRRVRIRPFGIHAQHAALATQRIGELAACNNRAGQCPAFS